MDSQRVRKPLRLTEYDYSVPGYYFVTLCTKNKEHLFWVPDVGATIIQQTKGRITKRAGFSLWQRSFYDHVIRGDDDYREIWHYIDSNPQKWQDDCYYTK